MNIAPLLRRFQALCSPELPEFVARRSGSPGPHLTLCCLTHGDETGSLPAAIELLESLDGGRPLVGSLTVILGNPRAAQAGVRFTEADLNRVFLPGPDSYERRRAAALMPLLAQADVVVDIHQTIGPTAHPFHIHPWSPRLELWARILQGAEHWVTRPLGESFASGTCCLDEYVRNQHIPALTIELGQQGIDARTTTLAAAVMERALAATAAMAQGQDLEALTHSAPPVQHWRTVHKEPYASPALRLRPGLRNFERVQAGELLSAPDSPELRAPCAGALLFPKYPPRDAQGAPTGPLPVDIFHLLTPMEQHPATLGWPAL
ncbi:MAG: succinylglutamate desuccinylase/aspartoacylase family protein [Myxococcota bacterium]|nr:succinylglutamate desuccinylase/aspartoacylase family protein [Myxococcota bacterium]